MRSYLLLFALACTVFCFMWSPMPVMAQGANSADLDGNKTVDSDDLLLFQEQWHTEGVVPPTPAPDAQVNAEIKSVTLTVDNKPEMIFDLVDDNGNPIDPTKASIRFTIAKIVVDPQDSKRSHYENYIFRSVSNASQTVTVNQATYDSGGTLTNLGNGQVKYKFGKVINITDTTLTHVIGGQISYTVNGKTSYSNPIYRFVPDGSPVTVTRQVATTDACNQCHDPISAHGGGRREYDLCVLCHNPGNIDPDSGNSVDMSIMIHKIHMGEALPSVESGTPYHIIGFNNEVHDYSEVVFPQDVRNCDTCHQGANAAYHQQVPSRAACGACHDDVNFQTGVGHLAGPQTNDNSCGLSFCHGNTMTTEFDNSVPGAHVIPVKSAQLKGHNAEILDVAGVAAGATVTVKFKLYENDNTPVAPSQADRVRLNMAGPTSDYTRQFTLDMKAAATDNGDGTYNYVATTPIPADAQGTWAFGIESRRIFTIIGEDAANLNVTVGADNPVVYKAVTGTLEPRREVVDLDKCNVCHDRLSLHGTQRFTIEYCVMCHNPVASDEEVRPATDMPPETIDFKVMIHKIHTGEELAKGYDLYGNRSSFHPYSHVLYPGDRRNCETCHLEGTYNLPAPAGASNTIIMEATQVISNTPPSTAACTACHDSDAAIAHAQSNTAAPNGAEACVVCHGEFRSEAVDVVHSRD